MNKLPVALPVAAFALPAIALVSAFAAPRATAEDITYRPAAGQRFAYTFSSTSSLNLTDMSASRDGEEWEGETPEVTLSHSEGLTFTDEIVEAEDGRVRELRRTFDEISSTRKQEFSTPEGAQAVESEGASELEGDTVVFTWDAEAEEYTAAFADEGGDVDLLEELECQIDFTQFLPEGSASKDDTWSIDAAAFREISSPGGDLHVLLEDEEPDEDGGMSDQIQENLEGEILCKLADFREEEGVRLAVISIQAKLSSHGSEDGEYEVPVGNVATTQEMKIEYELEGELLWNVTAGHASSIELTGELRLQVDGTEELSGEHEMTITRAQTFEGTIAYHGTLE